MPELRLARITPANIDAALAVKVRPDQEHFVSPVAKSLAEAYVHGETAWPRLILDEDGAAVGFLMAFLDIDWNGKGVDFRSGLWRLNVVPDAQGRGVTRMYVTWHPGDDGPEGFYRKLGFELTGETSGGQTVGVLRL
ncbi:GNAT family N-acetyltransferase [Nonomuraea sp. FMUSA5-5]|uniref:GNAT family N-acetyltransferase n=1 Tax=Nonomuraea composti TaxID=2720023 RepID=A0ABX1B838_9ACTN|nr:GNAT family N-acetyltransferase [Nonomuraea sp. FMUSA5-5]NJP91909.1 GNAT family N-acetyltransferase [Nonomuraea sp. FMUSA5-5]